LAAGHYEHDAQQYAHGIDAVTAAVRQPKKIHAFVIDDSKDMRDLLRVMLEGIGISSTEFRSGDRALAELESGKPDLVFVDLKMAPMDGLGFTRAVRRSGDERVRSLPIVMITGFADRSTIQAAREAGVSEFLAKPIAASVLRARTQVLLNRQQRLAAAPTPPAPPAPSTPDGPDLWLV
jgi:two-component system chemotaxis response regulator CheY